MIARQQQLAAGGRKSQSERAAQERVERKRKSCDAGSAAGAENWYKSSSTRAGRIVALENCLETAPLRSAQLSSVSRYRSCAAAAAAAAAVVQFFFCFPSSLAALLSQRTHTQTKSGHSTAERAKEQTQQRQRE